MPRGVHDDSPVVDPAALWGMQVPGFDGDTHSYGDQGIQFDPGQDAPPGPDLPASDDLLSPAGQPALQPPEVAHHLGAREDQDIAPPFEVEEGIPWPPRSEEDEAVIAAYESERLEAQLAGRACSQGHLYPEGARFCAQCGERLAEPEPQDWACGLGHDNQAASRFCPQCGQARPDLRAPVAGAGLAVEQLARPVVPEEALTPAQRAAREAQHAEALRLGAMDVPVRYQPPQTANTVLFHVVKSGWTWAGQVWFRGQEIELDVGSQRWREAQSFLHLTDAEQYERYGRICFRLGPWPGRKSYQDVEPGSYVRLASLDGKGAVTGPSATALEEADRRERARRRGVPAPLVR